MNHSSPTSVLVYMMHSPYVFAALLATRMFGEKPVLIITDLPTGASKPKNLLKRLVKPCLNYLLLKSISHHAGLVVLTRQMADDYAPDVPYIVAEGMVSPVEHADLRLESGAPESRGDAKTVCFAGLLRVEYGVKLLLDAFALIGDDSYRLWIFGRGDKDMMAAVESAARRDRRITYWGFQPNREVLTKEMESTVLVNPRLSASTFTRYSFPSKLLEYMSSGRPVISAPLPGIPTEYHEHLYLWRDECPAGLANLLISVCSQPPEELWLFGQRAREFVTTKKDYLTQGQRIYEFIQALRIDKRF